MEKYRRVFQGIPATTTELYGEMSRKVDYKVFLGSSAEPGHLENILVFNGCISGILDTLVHNDRENL